MKYCHIPLLLKVYPTYACKRMTAFILILPSFAFFITVSLVDGPVMG